MQGTTSNFQRMSLPGHTEPLRPRRVPVPVLMISHHAHQPHPPRHPVITTVQVEDNVRSLENQMEELERNEKTLDMRIEKKKQDLERHEKRLSTLQNVRPAYMDEYERLQGELNALYTNVGRMQGTGWLLNIYC